MNLPKYHWRPELPSKHKVSAVHKKYGIAAEKVDLSNHMSAVPDQEDLGSCTGNAIVGALEYLENKANGFTNTHASFVPLSRLYVYYNEREIEGTVNEDSGALISDGMKSLTKWGVCKEEIWPYIVSNFKTSPPTTAYADGANRKIQTYSRVPQTVEALTGTLAAGYPIVFGATIYDSFESDEVAGDGLVPMPDVETENCLGGHCILICGYDSTTKLFRVRNSWGNSWGDGGYCYFPYDYILDPELASDFYSINC
jgi:C1A family cysteine protease